MNVLEAIRTKRATRKFADQPVSEDAPVMTLVPPQVPALALHRSCAIRLLRALAMGRAGHWPAGSAWRRPIGGGSCIGSMYDPDKARTLLGVPADLTVQVALSFGFPPRAQAALARVGGRRPLADVVHWDRW